MKKLSVLEYDRFGKLFHAMHPIFRHAQIQIVCIGTDRATGDCLGPLVGTLLKQKKALADIYGTIHEPVHASNLEKVLEKLSPNKLTVAIDACLGNEDRIGAVNFRKGPLKPGTALKKKLPDVGDYHISGVVNVGGFFEHQVLMNTRFAVVWDMAHFIADEVAAALE